MHIGLFHSILNVFYWSTTWFRCKPWGSLCSWLWHHGPHSESANQIPQTSLGCQLCNEDYHSVLAVLFSFSLQEWLQSKSLVVLLSLSTQEEMYRFWTFLCLGFLVLEFKSQIQRLNTPLLWCKTFSIYSLDILVVGCELFCDLYLLSPWFWFPGCSSMPCWRSATWCHQR